ncbi:HD domain-containing protein [bacterium]|nr:HD domain-containing protein [bacterium]
MNETMLQQTEGFVEKQFANEPSGHDWWHIKRVTQLAEKLAQAEGADVNLCKMAALLHDLDDWKFNQAGDEPQKAKEWLQGLGLDANQIARVLEIIKTVSYKGAGVATVPTTLEGQCVQDADRLDAIGAIGIARTFAYGGHKGHAMYQPDVPPQMHQDFEAYKTKTSHTINHFYEKLLLLQDRMNTATARKIAAERHSYMEQFLDRFFAEWNVDF